MANSLPKETLEVLSEITDPPLPNDRVTIVLKPLGTNKTIAFVDGEDFNDHTLKVAKSYAVATIKDGKSKYQIDSNINSNNVPLTTPEGNPATISDDAPGGDAVKTFLGSRPGIDPNARTYFYSLSEPGIYNDNTSLYSKSNNRTDEGIKVIKGKTNPGPNDIDYETQFDQIPPKIGQSLINNNSNYPETDGNVNLYVTAGQQEVGSSVNRVKFQSTLGSYKKTLPRNEQGVGNDGFAGETTLLQQDFLNMGLQLPLKGTGELYVPKFGPNQTDETPAGQILAARLGALVPGAARLGIRIPVQEMTPTVVLDNDFNGVLKQDKKLNKTSNFPELASEPINSYGSYNNWIVPFDSIERLSQMPGLAIMVGGISLIVVAVAESLQRVTGKDTYSDQVRAGFISFFGLSSPGGGYDPLSFVTAVATAIVSDRMLNETGWYGTVIRSFIKNLFQEISRGVFAGAATGNFNGDTGILNRTGVDIYSDGIDGDIVGAAAKIVELFFNSKIVGFVNMLAEIGENQVLPTTNRKTNPVLIKPFKKGLSSANDKRYPLTVNQESFIDAFNDGSLLPRDPNSESGTSDLKLNSLVIKSRLQSNYKGAIGVRPLAWGTDITPSLYLLPDSIKKAAYAVKGQDGLNKLGDYASLNTLSEIDPVIIQNLEKKLEASYMPFTFQDMRTGEILSFHAFIESMQDQFQADYESETGFGRVEPTHIYKNTNRQMSLEFWVIATNPSDHDAMWLKINKLLTFVYPQYTAGRPLTVQTTGPSSTTQNQKFIQPYSQLVGSSPLIRMRVGDVWKSNYSKFNVMRLFGLGKSEFNLDNASFGDLNSTNIWDLEGRYKVAEERMLSARFDQDDQILISYHEGIDNRVFGIGPDVAAPRELQKPDLEPGLYTFKVVDVPLGSLADGATKPIYEYRLVLMNPEGGQRTSGYILRYANLSFLQSGLTLDLAESFQAKFSAFQNTPTEELWERSVAYSSLSLKMSIDYEWLKGLEPYVPVPETPSIDQIQQKIFDFFSTTGDGANPIMQAFENNKGKGIAGFITRLDVDWRDATWETEYNPTKRNSSRAPMSCKIQLNFLPIHDIVPGIDSDGFMTAPVYPVGRYANVTTDINPEPSTSGGGGGDTGGRVP